MMHSALFSTSQRVNRLVGISVKHPEAPRFAKMALLSHAWTTGEPMAANGPKNYLAD